MSALSTITGDAKLELLKKFLHLLKRGEVTEPTLREVVETELQNGVEFESEPRLTLEMLNESIQWCDQVLEELAD